MNNAPAAVGRALARACAPKLALLLVAMAALGAQARANDAGLILFCANLSADEESAPTYSSAVGLGRFTLRRSDLKLTWEVAFRDLTSPAVSANLHGPQRPGANAQVLFPLVTGGPITSPLKGSITLNDGQLEYLLTGRMYLNVATEKYPDGELRAQLQRVRAGATCPATATEPPAAAPAPARAN